MSVPVHDHDSHDHDHTHGVIDPHILTSRRGIWAIKWSFFCLFATALVQGSIVWLSGSVALFADTLHNLGDALTALPLWFAFLVTRRKPTNRFTLWIWASRRLSGRCHRPHHSLQPLAVGYQSLQGLLHPTSVEHLPAVLFAALIGFFGNEAVARLRLKVGREIGSAALVADGYHARADGLTSLGVLGSVGGMWLGYPLADPLVGVLIALAILKMTWESGKAVFLRLLDAVDPVVIDEIKDAMVKVPGVHEVTQVRVRWLGHRMHAEANITVNSELSIERGHAIAAEARHQVLHRLNYLSNATIHIDPVNASGEEHHRIERHVHGNLPTHSH
jgi:cation diffusion facilitator family transporter